MPTNRFTARFGLDNNNNTVVNVSTPTTNTDAANKQYVDASNTQLKAYTDGAIASANTQLKSYTDGFVSYISGVDAAQNTNITSANTQLKAYTDGAITSANNQLKSYTDGAINSANSQMKFYVDGLISYSASVDTLQNTNITGATTLAQAAYNQANTDYTTVVPTTGIYGGVARIPVITVASNGRITLVSNSTIAIDVSAATGTLPITNGGTNATSYTTGQRLVYDGSKLASISNTTTTVTGTLGADKTITSVTTNNYGDLTAYTASAIAIDAVTNITTGTLPLARGGTNATSFTHGQRVVFDGSKIASQANASTTVTGTLGADKTITSLSYNNYGELTAYTVSAIAIDAATNITTGTLPSTRGGTGLTAFTLNGALYATSTSALTTGTLPVASGGTGVTTSTGSGSNVLGTGPTISGPTFSGTVTNGTFSGGTWQGSTIGTAYGGTGLTSFTSGGAVYASSTSSLATGTLPVASGGTGVTVSTGTGYAVLNTSPILTTATLNSATLNSPTLVTPSLGTPASGTLTNCTFPTLNQNTTGTASNITAYTINQSVGSSNNVQFASLGVGGAASGTSGEIRAWNNITAYYGSDIAFKTNIKPIENALEKVIEIGGKTFDWTDEYIEEHGGEDGYFITRNDFGVVAQDVQKVFPQAVRLRENGKLAVDYTKLSVLAFAAIAELKAEIDELKKNR